MLRCIKGIQSDRLIIWHTENVTKKFQLPASDTFHQRLSVGHSIDSGIGDKICPFKVALHIDRIILNAYRDYCTISVILQITDSC